MRLAATVSRLAAEATDEPAPGDPLADGALDSLAMERFLTLLETRFGITFDEAELVAANFESVASVSELVRRKRRRRG
jgi:acyl carrier protein